MTHLGKIQIVIALLTICTTTAFGADTAKQQRGRQHGPPPEAYTACEDKTVGNTSQFVSPRGDTVSGTCEQEGDRLVLRPGRSR